MLDLKRKKVQVTLQAVSEQAGVSVSSVSRALKYPERVSMGIRMRVERAAYELGYVSTPINRLIIDQRVTQLVLVAVPDVCDPCCSELIRGIEETAAERGYLTVIVNFVYQQRLEKHFVHLMRNKDVAGVILAGGPLSPGKHQQYDDDFRHLPPVVVANGFSPVLDWPSVHVDNLTAAFEAVNYLCDLGHKRVACIAGPQDDPLCQYRLQGYIQALNRNGLTLESRYLPREALSFEGGMRAMSALLALSRPPTAVFCHCDLMAMGAMFYARRCGLRVPQALSIVGFDDLASAQYSDPPLTTVAQPRFEMGREAMLLLSDLMLGRTVRGGSRLLDCQLVMRGSAGAPGLTG